MTNSESGSAGGPAANTTQTTRPWRNRNAAILCLLGSLILGGFGVSKTISEYHELHYLYRILEIDQNAKDKIHRIWEGEPPGIVSALSAEGAMQADVDDAERQIEQHRVQAWLGGGLIVGGVALLGVGIVLFRRRAQLSPIGSVNAVPENGVADAGAEPLLQSTAVAPVGEAGSRLDAKMIGVGVLLAAIAVFAYLVSISSVPSSVPATDSSTTQPGAQPSTQSSATSAEPQAESASSQAPAAPQGSWRLSSETNPVTGEVRTVASLNSSSGDEQYIIIRLVGKKLDCYVNTNEFLETVNNMESRISTVQYKFDAGKVVRQGWSISANNEALFYPGNCATLIAQIKKAKTLALEFRPSETIPETITFDVEGFPEGFDTGK